MNIDFSRFTNENITSLPIEDQIEIKDIEINGRNIKLIKPVKINGNIYKVGQDKLLDITIDYIYSERCGRCLEEFSKSSKTNLTGNIMIGSEDNYDFQDEDDEIIFYDGITLDLTEDIINAIILDLPIKPICKEECKGICQECGVDKNKQACNCEVENLDPRLAKLKEFFKED